MLQIEVFLQKILTFFDGYLGEQWMSIIALTALVRAVLVPVSIKHTQFMRATQDAQPEMDRIKREFSHDKEQMNIKLAELYREKSLNPVMGCLPLVIQIPIILSLFSLLRSPDVISQSSMFLGWSMVSPDTTKIFPVLNGIFLALSSMNSMSSKGSTPGINPLYMSFGMAIMISFVSLKWTVALHLYMISTSILTIIQDRAILMFSKK